MRFISLHIKPALKGEVANVVSRRGYKAAYSSLFVTTPQSRLTPCQLPVKGSLMGNGFHCARQPRSSTQKFIVEAASEKKARHLACFDDSDASDADVRGGVEQLNHPRGPHFPIAHCGAIVYHFIYYLAHVEVELYEQRTNQGNGRGRV